MNAPQNLESRAIPFSPPPPTHNPSQRMFVSHGGKVGSELRSLRVHSVGKNQTVTIHFRGPKVCVLQVHIKLLNFRAHIEVVRIMLVLAHP